MANRPSNSNGSLLRKLAAEILRDEFPSLTFERLLCQPRDAMRFCRIVREKLGGVSNRSDQDILWTLLNCRKQGSFRGKAVA